MAGLFNCIQSGAGEFVSRHSRALMYAAAGLAALGLISQVAAAQGTTTITCYCTQTLLSSVTQTSVLRGAVKFCEDACAQIGEESLGQTIRMVGRGLFLQT